VRSQVEGRSFQTANLRHPAGACQTMRFPKRIRGCHALIRWTEIAVRSRVEDRSERSFQTANSSHPAGVSASCESHHHCESPREGHTGQVITWVQGLNLPGMQVQVGAVISRQG